MVSPICSGGGREREREREMERGEKGKGGASGGSNALKPRAKKKKIVDSGGEKKMLCAATKTRTSFAVRRRGNHKEKLIEYFLESFRVCSAH